MTKIRAARAAKERGEAGGAGKPAKPVMRVKARWLSGLLCGFIFLSVVFAQSGVLIPLSSGGKPDAGALSLAVMNVDILIDNQHATVKVVQVFDNHTAQTLEGKYVFSLPKDSSISDFAVWDGVQRIPGVMMERRRANQIYGEIKRVQTDPGILQTTDETESAAGFSAKIFPINAHGTKRLEMEYDEDVAVEDLTSHFTFPLKPSFGESQTVADFNLKVRVLSDHPVAPLAGENPPPYPLQITQPGPNEFTGEFHARDIQLENDFSLAYRLNPAGTTLSAVAYRAPERISAYDLRDPKLAKTDADGYFLAQAVFVRDAAEKRPPRRVVLALDTSLSMYGDKLARAVEAVDFFLHGLSPEDEFNLVLFSDEAEAFAAEPVRGTPENIEDALAFVKDSSLGGGTNLKGGLTTALHHSEKFSGRGESQIVLVSDANPTLETTLAKELEKVFDGRNVRLFAFALGADADEKLLRGLTAKTRGYFDHARETEDLALKLGIFFERVGTADISDFRLSPSAAENLYDIYPGGESSFFGSSFSFVGRYRKPQRQTIGLTARYGEETLRLAREVDLPELDGTHSFLPRAWARARVDALLQAMNRDGEREDYISEIIRLSEKYKIVTPYTAFLAAPRALLRPRLIQPGDPVIRVKTDDSVREVFAVLPFGETLPLKFLPAEGVWQTRFLAPPWMADGVYKCRLLLTDKDGNGYSEEKTFVVDSRAPSVKIHLEKRPYRAGEEILLKVSADGDTNRLTAKLYGAKPARLRWSKEEKANVGRLRIPDHLAPGRYLLTITAEDFAHNQTAEEVLVEVLGQ